MARKTLEDVRKTSFFTLAFLCYYIDQQFRKMCFIKVRYNAARPFAFFQISFCSASRCGFIGKLIEQRTLTDFSPKSALCCGFIGNCIEKRTFELQNGL